MIQKERNQNAQRPQPIPQQQAAYRSVVVDKKNGEPKKVAPPSSDVKADLEDSEEIYEYDNEQLEQQIQKAKEVSSRSA